MKTNKLSILATILLALTISTNVFAQSEIEDFIGSWALALDYESNSAGWLEIRQEEGYLDADILWRWGSVYPVEFVFGAEGHMNISNSREIQRKDENGDLVRTQRIVDWMDLQLGDNNSLTGIAIFPNNDGIGYQTVQFTGVRIPEADGTPEMDGIMYGDPIKLLGKKDLSGWELLEKGSSNGWNVKKGVLNNDPVQIEGEDHIHYGNLRTTELFEDFNLKLEVNVPAGSNSGVYLRGIYEIQVMDSYGKDPDSHNMGALYSRIVPSEVAEKPAGDWQKMDITLYKRHVTVVLNGKTIIDNQPVKGVTGGAMSADEFVPGPIYLQGDHGAVSYRKVVLTPILK
jgi:hypothetical protein